jgi:hypothetical protein
VQRLLLCIVIAGCGGAAAEGPLTIPTGMDRPGLVHELEHHAYCAGKDPPDAKTHEEIFPRCDAPGLDYGQSWVVVSYDEGGRVEKLQRWEKYSDADRLQDRFNDLVAKRTAQSGPASDLAKSRMLAVQPLPPGTKTWVAFQAGDYALAGIYLVDPQPPAYASLLEEIVAAP